METFGSVGFNRLISWIDNQNLFCEVSLENNSVDGSEFKQVKNMYYSCGMCRSVWVVNHFSYLVFAGMIATHRRECKKNENFHLDDSEILRQARIKFFFMLKKLARNNIKVIYVVDRKIETEIEKESKQSRFFERPWNVDNSKIFFELEENKDVKV